MLFLFLNIFRDDILILYFIISDWYVFKTHKLSHIILHKYGNIFQLRDEILKSKDIYLTICFDKNPNCLPSVYGVLVLGRKITNNGNNIIQ